jgi:AmmeMemoRadiSam system protein B
MTIIIIFTCLIFFPTGCQKQQNIDTAGSVNSNGSEVINTQPAHASFLTKKELYHILSVDYKKEQIKGTILAGVVPHHLVAGRLIMGFMDSLAEQNPGLLIVIGPNHHNLEGKVITGMYDWQTPDGPVKADQETVNILLEKGIAVKNEKVLSTEHSVGNIMPFIKRFTPKAKVVPIILHHDVSQKELDSLLNVLEPILAAKKGIILASVDFSHYLTRSQAQEKDRYTLKVMKDFDLATLFKLGNDYLDSPASLASVFLYAQRKGVRGFAVLENTNSGELLKNDLMETTSYFSLVFSDDCRR